MTIIVVVGIIIRRRRHHFHRQQSPPFEAWYLLLLLFCWQAYVLRPFREFIFWDSSTFCWWGLYECHAIDVIATRNRQDRLGVSPGRHGLGTSARKSSLTQLTVWGKYNVLYCRFYFILHNVNLIYSHKNNLILACTKQESFTIISCENTIHYYWPVQ